jgi:hypothetical protein
MMEKKTKKKMMMMMNTMKTPPEVGRAVVDKIQLALDTL